VVFFIKILFLFFLRKKKRLKLCCEERYVLSKLPISECKRKKKNGWVKNPGRNKATPKLSYTVDNWVELLAHVVSS
jgi:hypothetical protein